MRRFGGYAVVFALGAALGVAASWQRARRAENASRDHFVAGLIENVRLIREIRAGRADDLARRLTEAIPDYIWQIEEGLLDSPWRPHAFRMAKRLVEEDAIPLRPTEAYILKNLLGEPAPAAILRDGVVHVFPPGASFEVPPSWQGWFLTFHNNIHTPQDDLEDVVHGSGEWDTEYATVANAVFPHQALVFHGGEEGWGADSVSFGDLQVRVYFGELTFEGAEARVGAALPGTRVQESSFEDWTVLTAEFDVWYSDYGGTGRVESYLRTTETGSVGLVFLHTASDDAVSKIVSTFRLWGEPPNEAMHQTGR